MKQARYVVSATMRYDAAHSSTENHHLEADNDTDATFEAMAYVMDKAYADPDGSWGRGEITLIDRGSEKVLRTMKGKD